MDLDSALWTRQTQHTATKRQPKQDGELRDRSGCCSVPQYWPMAVHPREVLDVALVPNYPGLRSYDTKPLKATLERLVDFDRINSGEMRFSVGAVNVRTGISSISIPPHRRSALST
jgi:hypothetical protein